MKTKLREKNGQYAEHTKCTCCAEPIEDFWGIDFKVEEKILADLKEAFGKDVDFGKSGFFHGCGFCGNTVHDAYYFLKNGGDKQNLMYFDNEKDFFVFFIETLVQNGHDIKPYLFDKTISFETKLDLLKEILQGKFFIAVKLKDGKIDC